MGSNLRAFGIISLSERVQLCHCALRSALRDGMRYSRCPSYQRSEAAESGKDGVDGHGSEKCGR